MALFRPIHFMRAPDHRPSEWVIHRSSQILGLSYELAPNAERIYDQPPFEGTGLVKTNSYGMRDAEHVFQKADDLLRIAILGDSFTFGLGVPVEKIYPTVLERKLNQSARLSRYEVLNFGVIGYSTRQEALVLKHKALAWKPNIVIIGYVLNDPANDPMTGLHPGRLEPRWWQYSHLLRLVARVKYNWELKRLGAGDYIGYLHSESGDKWLSVVNAFREIKTLASSQGAKVLVVIFPQFPLSWPREEKIWAAYPHKKFHKQVSELATKSGFQVIDLYSVYASYPPCDLVLAPCAQHPNSLGHSLAARAIAEKLLTQHVFFFGLPKREGELTNESAGRAEHLQLH